MHASLGSSRHEGWTVAGKGLARALFGSAVVAYAALTVFGVFLWHGRAADLDLLYATYGFGPMSYVYKASDPAAFARDFPSGVENVDKSAAMRLYLLAYTRLGIEPETLFPIMLAVEIALMAVAMVVLTRVLRPKAPPVVAALVAALVLASDARNMNFALFAQPFFWAKYYNVADGLRILAVAAMLAGRPVACGALLAGAFMTHPTMGLTGVVFVAAGFALRPSGLIERRHLAGIAVLAALAGAWGIAVIGTGGAAGPPFPAETWFDLTRLNSGHWYPVDNGLLTSHHEARFLPFLSFLILAGFYLAREAPLAGVARRVVAGTLALLALVAGGLAFSVAPVSPTLVKLCLQRSNDLVLTVGLVYIVSGLWDEFHSPSLWRPLVAAMVLASPFVSIPGFPLALALLLAAPVWRAACRGRGLAPASLLAIVPAAGAALALVAYTATGRVGPLASDAYTGLSWLTAPPILVGLALLALALVVQRRLGPRPVQAVTLAGFAALAVWWAQGARLSDDGRALCRSFKDAQVWAREHTAPDALFMVDPVIFQPGIGYGWRDYSRRSSFGSLREWLYTAWCYNSDYRLCQEGLRRLKEFGINAGDYAKLRPPVAAFGALAREVHRRYYAASDDWRRDLARRYGIAFFVSRKLGTLAHSLLPRVYENERFVIHAASATLR